LQNIQQKLLAVFQLEHRDHLEQIRSLLAVVGKTGTGPARAELEEVFRRAHSLKGAARAVDLNRIEQLSHGLETLFSRILNGACRLDGEVNRIVHQVLDATEDCISEGNGKQSSASTSEALRALNGVLGEQATTHTAKEAPQDDTEPRHTQQDAAPEPAPAFQPLETVRITAENFDGLFRTAGGLVAESQRQDEIGEALDQLDRDVAAIGRESVQMRRAMDALRHENASPGLSRLALLVGSIEQRTAAVSRQARRARRSNRSRTWSLQQLGRQLDRDVQRARMAPADSLFEGYRKMMRDLARDENKKIEFTAASASVHADRRVLDALKDPIMHILRNAVSHGIEPASERAAKGKKPAGEVRLQIDTDGQRLIVTIEDDGRGVDGERVSQVAVRAGILSESGAALSSIQDLTRLLFRPGFSTSASVTALAGRGMGLSVVYETIRRLQGDVDLQPLAGGGTRITLSAPLSIARHRLIVLNCGGHIFAVPVLGVECLLRARRSGIETVEGRPMIMYGDQPVPLTSINDLLGLDGVASPNGDILQVVILRSAGQKIAIAIDAALREADAMIQDLGHAAGSGGKVASAAVLDDGSVAFVVNPMELIESALQPGMHRRTVPLLKPQVPAAKPSVTSILVVDDSMTTRALEKSILEAHGYKVRIAVDGVDALTRLREESADLVIADVEMPRLNGFGLIEAMKKDEKLDRIPVIIVSSLDRREDRERGLGLGADAYIVKRKFDQEELLDAIRQIV
jgi:two-component system, chemotaxis family, sensor kinase CheA